MVYFSVDKGNLIEALENALKNIELNADADISKVLLKLYITEGPDYDGKFYVSEKVCVSTIFFTDNDDSEPKEETKIYDIIVFKTDRDGQESYDYSETLIFEDTILLSKEKIGKILEFLNRSPSTESIAEILHSKYANKSCIKCSDKIIKL